MYNVAVMAKNIRYKLFFMIFLLINMSACASMNPFSDGETTVDLDGNRKVTLELKPGDIFNCEMRNPSSSGYDFAGIIFDPTLIKLHKFQIINSNDDKVGDGRWLFEFSVLDIGESLISINIKRPQDLNKDAYKEITIISTKDGPPLFKW